MRLFTLFLGCLSLLPFAAVAAGPPAPSFTLVTPPPIGSHIDSLPRIANPTTQAELRINRALAHEDGRDRASRASCPVQAGEGGWRRNVQVVMRGAGYLSVVVDDSWDCSNSLPSGMWFGLAYDLRTGSPLNWARLLPKSLVQSTELDEADDTTPLGTVGSPALTALYLKLETADHDFDPSCGQALQDTNTQFQLWPDAQANGVAIVPDGLPQVIQACANQETIPLATLRQIGANPRLVDAIAAAHQAGEFDKKQN
jgi:hypothetical protein